MKDCKAWKSESTGANKDSKVTPANKPSQAKLTSKAVGVTEVCTNSTVPLDYLPSFSGLKVRINAVHG